MKGRSGEVLSVEEHLIEGSYEYQIKVSGEIWKARSKTKYNIGDQVHINDRENLYLII